MWLLWIHREASTLVGGVRDVRARALLEVVELAYDAPVVEAILVMRWRVLMATQ